MGDLTLRVVGLGHTLTFSIPASATVADLKSEIESQTSLPSPYQRLLARGKKLDDDTQALADAGIEDRTRLMLLHSESYASDRSGAESISALVREVDDLEEKAKSGEMGPNVVHELVTQICCKLDGVETHGSEVLRAMRKNAIERAEGIDRSCTEKE